MSKIKLPNHQTAPDIKTEDPRVLTELLFDFYDGIVFTPFSAHAIESVRKASSDKKELKGIIDCLYEPELIHETGV